MTVWKVTQMLYQNLFCLQLKKKIGQCFGFALLKQGNVETDEHLSFWREGQCVLFLKSTRAHKQNTHNPQPGWL